MPASRDVDCVVVGAGLAGATLAIGLAQLGLRVATIDARSPTAAAPGRDVRGLALAPSSQLLLSRLGLWPALAEAAIPLKTIVVTDRGQFGSTHLSAADAGVPALGYVCPAYSLLGRLDAALEGSPGCTPYWQTTVSSIEAAAGSVVLTVAGMHEPMVLETGLLVAADGMHSAVRRHFDIAVTSHDYQQTAIVANVEVDAPRPDTAFERFTRDGPLAVLPLGGSRVVAVRSARTADLPSLMALSSEDFAADLSVRFGPGLGRFHAMGERRAYPLKLSRARALHAPRTVLIGNAANTIHPNGAQGLNLGLRDVATLLDCLASAVNRGEDIGAAELLAGYARRRRPDHERTVRFSDGLARAFGFDSAPLGVLRGAALLACDVLPPLKRALLGRLMGLRGESNAWLRAPAP